MFPNRWHHVILFDGLCLLCTLLVAPSTGAIGPRCPGQIGGDAGAAFYLTEGTDVHLILNATFPCIGNVSAWLCNKPDDFTPVFVAVWRPLVASVESSGTGNVFRLVGKNHIPLGYVGSHVFRIKRRYQVRVRSGDYLGYHYSLKEANHTREPPRAGAEPDQAQVYSQLFQVGARFQFHPNGKLGHVVHRRDSVAAMLDYGQAPLSVNNRRACEGEEVELSCSGGGELLLVRTARYGVLAGRCSEPLAMHAGSTTCFRAVWHVVHARCTGRSRCKFRVTEHIFGDPCPDRSQTLDIEYACVQGNNNRYPGMAPAHVEKIHGDNESGTHQTSLLGGLLDGDTGHQLPLPVPLWDERRRQEATSGGAGGEQDTEKSMPTTFTVPNEQKGAIVAGVLALLVLLGGLLAAGIVLYRRRSSKMRRSQSLHNVQSQLIDHHLRLNPTYLDHQNVDALRRACTPGGTMDTLRTRLHLQYHEEEAQPAPAGEDEGNAVNYEVVYDNMLVRPQARGEWRGIGGPGADWTGVDGNLAGRWEAEKKKLVGVREWNTYMNLSVAKAVRGSYDHLEEGRVTHESFMVGLAGAGAAATPALSITPAATSPSVGPPKPPRVAPYALVAPTVHNTDSENSSDSESSDFSSKPNKFRIWSQRSDEELDKEEEDRFSDDEDSSCSEAGDACTHKGIKV